jgi:DNA-binding transcriptional ArsR family regulator
LARFSFSPDDVARIRFTPAAAPVLETVLLMAELRGVGTADAAGTGRPRPDRRRPDRWLREARAAFPATARPLLDLLRPCLPWPDFLDSFAPDLKDGLEEVRCTPTAVLRAQLRDDWRDRPGRPPLWVRELADGDRDSIELVVRALRDLHRAVIEPRWDAAVVVFHAEVARRMPALAARGHAELFGALHPQLRWRDNGLDRSGFDGEWAVGGQGMVLAPSVFWTGAPLFSLSDNGTRPSTLVYAAQPGGHRPAEDGLAALLGPTRAAVLRALAAPRGTGELAGIVGISPASASEHAKVLREVFLIETLRDGRAVRHSLTALGRTLLGQLPEAPPSIR